MKRFKSIYIEITNICNKNCTFCKKTTRTPKSMTLLQFEHIVKEIKPFTDYIYLHIMGEPLLHSELEDMLKVAKQNCLYVNITTNGTLLNDKINILISQQVRQINISLHSFEEENINNFSHYLNNVFSGVKTLLEKTDTYLSLRLWTLDDTLVKKQRLKKILTEINKNFETVCNISNYVHNGKYRLGKRLFLNLDKEFKWPSLHDDINFTQSRCRGMVDMCGILSNGDVVICCLDGNGHTSLGNIFAKNFKDIINSETAIEIENGFKNNKAVAELCKHCTYRNQFR